MGCRSETRRTAARTTGALRPNRRCRHSRRRSRSCRTPPKTAPRVADMRPSTIAAYPGSSPSDRATAAIAVWRTRFPSAPPESEAPRESAPPNRWKRPPPPRQDKIRVNLTPSPWLKAERAELEVTLGELERQRASFACSDDRPALVANPPSVTAASSTFEKVALFRRLFVGRPDVFPVRWENRKTGRSGYAPACANEWVKGICGKPQIKCGQCPHQAFIPVSDDIIEKHLRGG